MSWPSSLCREQGIVLRRWRFGVVQFF